MDAIKAALEIRDAGERETALKAALEEYASFNGALDLIDDVALISTSQALDVLMIASELTDDFGHLLFDTVIHDRIRILKRKLETRYAASVAARKSKVQTVEVAR